MNAVTQTIHIDNEQYLQDVLVGNGIGKQGILAEWKRMIDAGTGITVIVPGVPPRAIVRKSAVDQQLSGHDLVALPLS